jgi:hypothetical protein
MTREKSVERKQPEPAGEKGNDNDIEQLLNNVEKNMYSQPKHVVAPQPNYNMLPTIKPSISNTFTYGTKPVLALPFNKFTKENFNFDSNYIKSNILKQPIQKYVSDYQDKNPIHLNKPLDPIGFDYMKKLPNRESKEKEERLNKRYLEPLLFGKQYNSGQNSFNYDYKYKT